jgi:hypothetical protein
MKEWIAVAVMAIGVMASSCSRDNVIERSGTKVESSPDTAKRVGG